MTKYLTGRFSKILILLVGVCLTGSAFHIHQLHPDYRLQDSNVAHHLGVEQPDCIACLNLMQAVPAINEYSNTIRHEPALSSVLCNRVLPVDFISNLNNKSPPADYWNPRSPHSF